METAILSVILIGTGVWLFKYFKEIVKQSKNIRVKPPNTGCGTCPSHCDSKLKL